MAYTPTTWVDEVLAADARYDILEDGGGAFKADMRIELATAVSVAGTAVTAARMNNIETGLATLDAQRTGWIAAGQTWTYVSANSLVIGGQHFEYQKGDKIMLTQTTVKYFYVVAIEMGANTTLTITGGIDYTLANAAITDPYYSKAAAPEGFPGYFNWTPTFVSSGATFTYASQLGTFTITEKILFVTASISLTGAPGGTTSNSLSFALPVAVGNITGFRSNLGVYWSIVTLAANMTQLMATANDSVTAAQLRWTGSGQTVGTPTAAALGSGATLGISGQYLI
jgi:hypothetical protein